MSTIPCVLVVAVLVFAASRYRCSADVLPPDSQIEQIIRDRVAAKQQCGIVVGVIDASGQRIFAAGKTSLDGPAANGDTLYEVGSVTKVFTGLLLADMAQRGEVNLNDPISKYLPATVKTPTRGGKQITLLDLATHRSGLPRLPDNMAPRDPENPYTDYTFEELCAFLSDYKLTRDIGEKYEYSNLGFGLLGNLLARKAGMSYEALVSERILRPLGMGDTTITLSAAQKSRMAAPYDDQLEPKKNWDFDALAGCGAIRSDARDLLKFVAANMQLTVGPLQAAMQSMQSPISSTDLAKTRVGIAWHITDKNGKRVIWHNGGTYGYHSFIGFDPTNKIGVVVLANSANSIDDIGFHLIDSKRALEKLKKEKVEAAARVTPEVLDKYVGRYQLTPSVFFDLKRDGARLMAQLTGQAYYEIYPKSETSFFYKVVDAQIDFNRDATGKVESLTLHQNGADQTADKISDQPAAERKTIKLPSASLDNYPGKYQLNSEADFTIRRDGDRLLARLTGQAFFEIFPESETEFFYKVVDAQLTFVKGPDGKMKALILHQNGADQRAERTGDAH